MTSTDKDGYRRQRESERAWLAKPLTIGGAIALLVTNVFVTLVIVGLLA
jgi:hypothetical protein